MPMKQHYIADFVVHSLPEQTRMLYALHHDRHAKQEYLFFQEHQPKAGRG